MSLVPRTTSFLNRPMFVIGVILFSLFLFQLSHRGLWRWEGVIPTSCKSALVMLKKRMDTKTWQAFCVDNDMKVIITPDKLQINPEKERQFLYVTLANSLLFVSKNCLEESLERTDKIHLTIEGKTLSVVGMTSGKKIIGALSLSDQKQYAEFLQKNVQVKEIPAK